MPWIPRGKRAWNFVVLRCGRGEYSEIPRIFAHLFGELAELFDFDGGEEQTAGFLAACRGLRSYVVDSCSRQFQGGKKKGAAGRKICRISRLW